MHDAYVHPSILHVCRPGGHAHRYNYCECASKQIHKLALAFCLSESLAVDISMGRLLDLRLANSGFTISYDLGIPEAFSRQEQHRAGPIWEVV